MDKKLERLVNTSLNPNSVGPDPRKKVSTSFQPGVFHAGRAKTYFKAQNFYGYPSREAWSAAFKERQSVKKLERRVYAKVTKTTLEIQERARQIAEKALDRLEELVESDQTSESSLIHVTALALERGYGKAAQTNINIDGSQKPNEVSSQELSKRIAEAVARVERLTGGVREEGAGEAEPSDIRKYH